MNKYFFSLLIVFFLVVCPGSIDVEGNPNLIHEISNNKKNEFSNINDYLIRNNINNPQDINFEDNNYNYLFAKLFYKNYQYKTWFFYYINNALSTDNLFKEDAFWLLVDYLFENRSWDTLKDLVNNNKELFTKNPDKHIYITFAEGKSLTTLDKIPDTLTILPLLAEVVKNDKEALKESINQEKLIKFVVNTKLYEDKKFNSRDELRDIVNWSNFDPFISCIYYYYTNNYKYFINSLGLFLQQNRDMNEEKLNVLKKLVLRFGGRKDFYYKLSIYKNSNIIYQYFYALEVMNYVNYKSGLEILNSILPNFKKGSFANYDIRGIILGSNTTLTDSWVKNVIEYYNDYPDSYKSKNLINILFQKLLTIGKIDLIKPYIDMIDFSKMEANNKSDIYYFFYIFDTENKDKWSKKIIEEFPLSYEALTLTNGDIKIKFTNRFVNLLSVTATNMDMVNLSKKVAYLLDFDLFDEVVELENSTYNQMKKVYICNELYNYLIDKSDYYNALKYVRKIICYLYDDNLYNMDDIELIKKLYPLHYKDLVLKYSEKYNVDSAVAFAVMREESNFKSDIRSYRSARGLMQIMPATGKFIAKKLNIKSYNLNNPEDNINMGIYYLKFLERYFDKTEFILSSYNAGQGRTLKWYKQYKNFPDHLIYELIPIYETRDYIRKVMKSYHIYKYLLKLS